MSITRVSVNSRKRWVRDSAPGKFVYPSSNTTGLGLYNLDDYTAGSTRIHVQGEVIFREQQTARGRMVVLSQWSRRQLQLDREREQPDAVTRRGHDACGIRGFVWAGTWTHVG